MTSGGASARAGSALALLDRPRPGRPEHVAQLGPGDLPETTIIRRLGVLGVQPPPPAVPTRPTAAVRVLTPARRARRQLSCRRWWSPPPARSAGGAPLAGFALSLGLLALAVRPGLELPAGRLVLWLRLAMTVGALGCAFCSTIPGPPGVAGSLLLRRSLRVALLLPATAAWWVGVVWRVQAVHPGLPLPVAALTLEAAALLAVTVALAAAGSRVWRPSGAAEWWPRPPARAHQRRLPAARPGGAVRPAGQRRLDGAHRRWALLLGLALASSPPPAPRSRPPPPPQLAPRSRCLAHPPRTRPTRPRRASRALRVARRCWSGGTVGRVSVRRQRCPGLT